MTREEEEEIIAYEKAVEVLAKNEVDQIIFNSGDEHALIVLKNIFSNSREEIRILAGGLHNNVTDSKVYIDAISTFIIKNNGKVKILLDNYNCDDSQKKDFFSTPLFDRLRMFKENVEIRVTKEAFHIEGVNDNKGNPQKVHFCVGDKKRYRLEYDTDKRKAICNFNDSNFSSKCIEVFDESYNKLSPILF